MPVPQELSQQIPTPWAKAQMQKPQGGGKFLLQISGGTWGEMVMDEIDTCISTSIIMLCPNPEALFTDVNGGDISQVTFQNFMLV